jgi:2-hydroxycyclohexanecarboxyl-CoA dehydrogenase
VNASVSKEVAAGRVAVITGGASGIGLGVATHLAEAGRPVALLDRQGDLAVKEAEALQAGGARAIGIETDVSDRASIDAALGRVRAELGPIAIAVTSAGIEAQTPFCEIPADEWDRIIAVNLTGTFHSLQAAVPDMKVAGWGRIVTISSSSAPSIIDTPMAQGGVAAGHVPDIDVLATMTPVRRTGTPDDVAAACAFLCSDAAGFITGQIIGVNGGWYM